MEFSKLLFQSLFNNVPDWPQKQKENCYQPCIKYKTPPCKSLPKYLPQQFPPYYDDIDPNSIIKYREWPKCIETFETEQKSQDHSTILLIILIVALCINLR
jgi:hypothetical protein